jgi:segregation and condensation protein B
MNNKSVIESILYVSGSEGIDVGEMKKVLNIPVDEIRKIIKEMKEEYDTNPNMGLTIKTYGSSYYLLTKPENKDFVSKLIDIRVKNPLSPSILESLAIIAYNSPCQKSKIDEIRGINSDGAINKLVELGLIEDVGRASTPGRPFLYQVTQKFFNLFGLKSIKDLPKLDINAQLDLNEENLNFFDSGRFKE